jgi:hypothetical protein
MRGPFARSWTAAFAAVAVCAAAAGAARIEVIGSSPAKVAINGKRIGAEAELPKRARVSVAGGLVYLKAGSRMLEIDDAVEFVVRGNKVKITSGSMIMINAAGMTIALVKGESATLEDVPGGPELRWEKPAVQIPSEYLPSPPPPPIPNQNLQVVSPSAP